MRAQPNTVAIVGGGASGTLAAIHLLHAASGPLMIVLIERERALGAGAAFAATQDFHLLNVPAGRMSAFAADPDHFVRWLAGRGQGADFVPRRLYRGYLGASLRRAELDARPDVTLERLRGEVVSVDLDADGSRACVRLGDGSAIAADRVVLAIGNASPVPVVPPSMRGYVGDPWRPTALDTIPQTAPVLLLGTGLTMVDSVLSLLHAGHPGPFVALSRRGRLPEAHVPAPAAPERLPLCGELSLRTLTRLVRDAAECAVDWRAVVDGLRPHAQALWGQLSDGDKRRFVRHVRPYWDNARHRLAPDVAQAIATLRASGRLVVRAGRLIGVDERAVRLHATWRARGAATHETLVVAGIVNCTGPSDAGAALDPVVSALIRSGHATVGASGIGLATGSQGALLAASGLPSRVLFTLGPPRKGDLWESTAIPEIRTQAQALAEVLIALTEKGSVPFSVRGRRGSRA